MARLVRVSPAGVPQHIIQRGNNRQSIFADDADMKAYLGWLKEYSKKHLVDIHAWVLMTNHVHIPCPPQEVGATIRMSNGKDNGPTEEKFILPRLFIPSGLNPSMIGVISELF